MILMWKYILTTDYGERLHFKKEEKEMIVYKSEIADAMTEFGGSFVHFLWEALHHADMNNSKILINSRPGYIEEYANKFVIPNKLEHI